MQDSPNALKLMLTCLKPWIYAARPKTLVAAASPVLIGSTMAYQHENFSFHIFTLILLGSLFIQIGTNYANDYFDFIKKADTDKRIGPQKILATGAVTPCQMRRAFFLCFLLSVSCTIPLIKIGGAPLLWIIAASILSGIMYSASSFSLSRTGLADFFVFIFFGPVATVTTYYLQTQSIPLEVVIASLAPGLMGIAILTVNNLRDIEEDTRAKKQTLVARFGITFGRWQYLTVIALSSLVPVMITALNPHHFLCCLASLSLIPSIPLIRFVFSYENPVYLNAVLPKTGILLLLYTGCFCIGWLL